jgi:hypothetical protein
VIRQEGVDFNEMGSFRTRNIKRGLYWTAPGIGNAPVKRDMKDILKSEVKRLDEREITKAIEWLSSHGFPSEELQQNFVYRSFVKNTAWPPDNEVQIFMELEICGSQDKI